ncbi:MAG TPA: beta-ketoacyl synthase N-terminal-like domain-containing protein [Chthoniobacterales bacterium]|nr:beta-ketoacyl synthase N-terminal-like domain-containing protein [Chthoniobacterales bacterium]
MNFFVQGIGAVTPLGPTALETWAAICRGEQAPRKLFANGLAGRSYFSCPVPAKFVADASRQPRLRRSGTISLLGAAAGFDAFADAGLKPDTGVSGRIAVVFAICSGGIKYTRRFYNEIVTQGANSASPLLFPETVYNAAASHLAALLGVNRQSYTLVGDSSVGLGAIHFAIQLLAMQPELDRCLVVGTEEADWLLADAFASWRMAGKTDQFEVYGRPTGTIFGEGAAAVLIGRTGQLAITESSPGVPFWSIRESEPAARAVFGEPDPDSFPEFIVSSANGTFVDEAERKVFNEVYESVPVYAPKPAIGDALGASGLLQVVLAVFALRHQELPGTVAAGSKLPSINRQTRPCAASQALVTCVGFNHQVNALKMRVL